MLLPTALLLCSLQAYAFPSLNEGQFKRQISSPEPGFDPTLQYVSTSGSHAWVAPSSSDMRGPCPGLNAAANHNYIPHNGIATIQQATTGLEAAYGCGTDLCAFLATVAAINAGDALSFSIGGPPPPNLIAGGLLGQPGGLSNSHAKFEGDGSPTRGDLYEFGNDYLVQLPFFEQMLALPVDPDEPNYTLELLGQHSVTRYQECVAGNPYYMRTPVGFLIPPGTLGIIAGMFSNHSAEYPNGFLSAPTLRTFFSVSGSDSAPVYTPGYERIPDNFYKRNPATEYTTADFGSDLAFIYSQHPEDLAFGGNTGTVNSFTPINVENMTNGVYNAQTLAQGNNFACFMYQNSAQEQPDLLTNNGVLSDITGALNKFNAVLGPVLSKLECPQLQQGQTADTWDQSVLQKYPGWTKWNPKTGGYK